MKGEAESGVDGNRKPLKMDIAREKDRDKQRCRGRERHTHTQRGGGRKEERGGENKSDYPSGQEP